MHICNMCILLTFMCMRQDHYCLLHCLHTLLPSRKCKMPLASEYATVHLQLNIYCGYIQTDTCMFDIWVTFTQFVIDVKENKLMTHDWAAIMVQWPRLQPFQLQAEKLSCPVIIVLTHLHFIYSRLVLRICLHTYWQDHRNLWLIFSLKL